MIKKIYLIFILFVFVFTSSIAIGYSKTELDSANYLAALGIIVDQSSNPEKYLLDNNVLRQEIAAVTTGLACVSKKTACDNMFADVTGTKPNNWACQSIEALLEANLVSYNLNFRPEDNISKAEAVGMVVKAIYGNEYRYNDKLILTWQEQVVNFASDKGIVDKFKDYNALATRGFVFHIASVAIARSGKTCDFWNIITDGSGSNTNNSSNNGSGISSDSNNNSGNTGGEASLEVVDNGTGSSSGNTGTSSRYCESTRINGYTVPKTAYGYTVDVSKTVDILYGDRQHTQKFECRNGEFLKIGTERIGYANCVNGEKQDPNDRTICLYIAPSGGGGERLPPINGVCGTANSSTKGVYADVSSFASGTIVFPYTIFPANLILCTKGSPTNISIDGGDDLWRWSCTGLLGGSSVACSAPQASCMDEDFSDNFVTTIGSPTSSGQVWQNTDSKLACYYTCKAGFTGDDCSEKIKCEDKDFNDNTITVEGTPIIPDQVWQNADSNAACYYSCKEGFTGDDCATSIGIADMFSTGYPLLKSFSDVEGGVVAVTDGDGNGYVIQDKNVGGIAITPLSRQATNNIGLHYQWGRNLGFDSSSTIEAINGTGAALSQIDFASGSTNTQFIWSGGLVRGDWATEANNTAWTDGPCPDGYHIPTMAEWMGLLKLAYNNGLLGNTEGNIWTSGTNGYSIDSGDPTDMMQTFGLSYTGGRNYNDGLISDMGQVGYYWTSEAVGDKSKVFVFTSGLISFDTVKERANGYALRCFRDSINF